MNKLCWPTHGRAASASLTDRDQTGQQPDGEESKRQQKADPVERKHARINPFGLRVEQVRKFGRSAAIPNTESLAGSLIGLAVARSEKAIDELPWQV